MRWLARGFQTAVPLGCQRWYTGWTPSGVRVDWRSWISSRSSQRAWFTDVAFASTTVFTLVCPTTRRRHAVQLWGDYGTVCTTLWTTNGNVGYLAKLVAGYVRVGSLKVTRSKLPKGLCFSDERALREALIEAYRTWNATVNSPLGVVSD